jgi:hypothetical protein
MLWQIYLHRSDEDRPERNISSSKLLIFLHCVQELLNIRYQGTRFRIPNRAVEIDDGAELEDAVV